MATLQKISFRVQNGYGGYKDLAVLIKYNVMYKISVQYAPVSPVIGALHKTSHFQITTDIRE
jgi:hypothetical protein